MTFNLLNENKMTSKNMSKKETKAELLKNIRLELFKKKKIIPAKTFTTLSGKLYALEFSKKNNMKSIENFYEKEIQSLNKETNTKEKLIIFENYYRFGQSASTAYNEAISHMYQARYSRTQLQVALKPRVSPCQGSLSIP